ncbi:hypothetical protein CYMTET_43590 [Cymbomonas tetramitiformis]|uniref:Uncharacterized protein n=1 Tax=Cymbomonas tetramitiformis TaxID=36881 RepID=A0AAE0F0G9_9CHLO|nr:hypothetical protein CYMTET_43590 [Cymbomonas tetramitiformis]
MRFARLKDKLMIDLKTVEKVLRLQWEEVILHRQEAQRDSFSTDASMGEGMGGPTLSGVWDRSNSFCTMHGWSAEDDVAGQPLDGHMVWRNLLFLNVLPVVERFFVANVDSIEQLAAVSWGRAGSTTWR